MRVNDTLSPHAQQTYDTVWTVALTLRKSMEVWKTKNKDYALENFTYHNRAMRDTFFNVMGDLEFMGVSVSVGISTLIVTVNVLRVSH